MPVAQLADPAAHLAVHRVQPYIRPLETISTGGRHELHATHLHHAPLLIERRLQQTLVYSIDHKVLQRAHARCIERCYQVRVGQYPPLHRGAYDAQQLDEND